MGILIGFAGAAAINIQLAGMSFLEIVVVVLPSSGIVVTVYRAIGQRRLTSSRSR